MSASNNKQDSMGVERFGSVQSVRQISFTNRSKLVSRATTNETNSSTRARPGSEFAETSTLHMPPVPFPRPGERARMARGLLPEGLSRRRRWHNKCHSLWRMSRMRESPNSLTACDSCR